jgi:uncharacterized OB-fold protein
MAPLPKLRPDNEFYWTSGRDGCLRFLRCQSCRYYVHPPSSRCPQCLNAELKPEAVSGVGEVLSFTFVDDAGNANQNVIAWIGFPEQADLRVTARLAGVAPPEAAIGMSVSVDFEAHGEVFLPVFRPTS